MKSSAIGQVKNVYKQDELESLLEERLCLENGPVSVEVLINAVNDCFNLDLSVPTAQIILEHMDGMTIAPGLDNKGVFFICGLNRADGHVVWSNPAEDPEMVIVTRSSDGCGKASDACGCYMVDSHTRSGKNSWYEFEFSKFELKMSKYMHMHNCKISASIIRLFSMSGWNADSGEWEVIREITQEDCDNGVLIDSKHNFSYIFDMEAEKYYSRFRLDLKGPCSSGDFYICLGRCEMYGTLRKKR